MHDFYEALFLPYIKLYFWSQKNLFCLHRNKFWQGENTLLYNNISISALIS